MQILVDFSAAQVLTFDEAAARTFEELRTQRVRVGTMDLRIASIALSRDFTVLTRNRVDQRCEAFSNAFSRFLVPSPHALMGRG